MILSSDIPDDDDLEDEQYNYLQINLDLWKFIRKLLIYMD